MKEELISALARAVSDLGISADTIRLEYPEDPAHGDYSSNIAMANGKKLGMAPKALAEKIVAAFGALPAKAKPGFIESVTIAGPGFINFKVKDKAFVEMIGSVATDKEYGWGKSDKGKKIMVEYTDPNPFKVFHIGHLMSNAIGESISRLIEAQGADVKRANWQGDVGPHVAKALWGAQHLKEPKSDFASSSAFWGNAYAFGAKAYDEDVQAKQDIDGINKKVYDRSDSDINMLYDVGRQDSLEAFEKIYAMLGTKFDNYFFEGIEGRDGEAIVRESLKKGVFEESEGAIVFKGEKYGLHTRVFITSKGLPTYETKELGLNQEKFKLYPDLAESIIITANEQSDYFKVLLKVFSLIRPDIAEKTRHMSHGLLRFASGKMSSRTGNVISGESLINDIKQLAKERMDPHKVSFSEAEIEETSNQVAIAAIKYTILRQGIGGDVIFDSAASISFEGDSGPYLQYSAVRAQSILIKAAWFDKHVLSVAAQRPESAGLLERLISRFPDIVTRARNEYAPQLIANYLISLASAFNSFYSVQVIVDKDDPLSPYRIALTKAFLTTMTNGLWILGIKVPKKM